MLLDANDFLEDKLLQADLLVVGAGPAGISIARSFIGSDVRVCLLESGGIAVESNTQDLNDGEISMRDGILPVGSRYLRNSRKRLFGGSSLEWRGLCMPMTDGDFAQRDWVPHSGWPIARRHLEPYYDRACEIVGVRKFDYDPNSIPLENRPLRLRGDRALVTKLYHLSTPPTRFADYRRELIESPNIQVVLHANVLELLPVSGTSRVSGVVASTLHGRKVSIEAEDVVIACGGVENARLLLASRSNRWPNGIGNQQDLVGRYFMEHPHASMGRIAVWKSLPELLLYFERYHHLDRHFNHRILGVWCPTEETLSSEKITNFACQLWSLTNKGDMHDDYYRTAGAFDTFLSDTTSNSNCFYGDLFFRFEQVPNASSRVLLSSKTDEFGRPRARLDWRLSELDYFSFERAVRILAREFGAGGLGRVAAVPVNNFDFLRIMGNHHMGTTRMAASPTDGVVDADAKVHGVENLFVAGSSVFPTAGFANPTLTLIALSERLADHLKQRRLVPA